MKTFVLILLSVFILTGCQAKQDLKNKVLDEVEQKVDQVEEKVIETGDKINDKIDEERQEDQVKADDPTDQQLLDELNSDDGSESELKNLENELN